MIKIIRVCYHFLTWISTVQWMQQKMCVLGNRRFTFFRPLEGCHLVSVCFWKRWKRMQIQRKRTSLQSQRKRRPSGPATQKLWHLPRPATWYRSLEISGILFVGHMAIGSKTIGKCSDFLTHRFWNKGRCWRKHDTCRIITIRFVKEKDKEKEPPRSRRVFVQVRNRCWLLSCCHNFRSSCCLHSMVCFVGHSSSVTPLGLGELLLLQGDRPKLERSLTQNLEEPKAKSKAVRMKVGPDRICQWWILGWEMSGSDDSKIWFRWLRSLLSLG